MQNQVSLPGRFSRPSTPSLINPGDGLLKPVKITRDIDVYGVDINAAIIVLVVDLVNNTNGVTFSVGAQSEVAGAGAQSAQLQGALSGDVVFGLTSLGGNHPWFSGTVVIDRPPYSSMSAGCVIIPAIPVAVIYQPPSPNARTTFGILQRSGIGTLSIGGDVGEVPQKWAGFADIDTAIKVLNTIQTVANGLGKLDAAFQAIGAIAGLVSGALQLFRPLAGPTETPLVNTSVNSETTVVFSYSQEVVGGSVPAKASPEGDAIMFVRDAAFAYYSVDGKVTLVPLGNRGLDVVEVSALRPGATNPPDLPASAMAALLAADPVASGVWTDSTGTRPDPQRYSYVKTYQHNDESSISFIVSHTEEASTTVTETILRPTRKATFSTLDSSAALRPAPKCQPRRR